MPEKSTRTHGLNPGRFRSALDCNRSRDPSTLRKIYVGNRAFVGREHTRRAIHGIVQTISYSKKGLELNLRQRLCFDGSF